MGEGDGNGIGHIGRAGRRVEPALRLHRPLHLLFGCVAKTSDGFFDSRGRQMFHLQPMLTGTEQDDSSRMSHQNCGTWMLVVSVELLHRQLVRFKLID